MITNPEPSDASPASDEGGDGKPSPASTVAASPSTNSYARVRG
jgi:hypothetical protein